MNDQPEIKTNQKNIFSTVQYVEHEKKRLHLKINQNDDDNGIESSPSLTVVVVS